MSTLTFMIFLDHEKRHERRTKTMHTMQTLFLFEYFKTNQRTGQLTKTCIQCLERKKLSIERTKCPHGKRRHMCVDCGGTSTCHHKKQKAVCKQCGGSQICEHNIERSVCKKCKGGKICMHNSVKSACVKCGGGSICEHSRARSICKDCKGSQICPHERQRRYCPICDPQGHLASVVSCRIRNALRDNKEMSSQEYIGCDILTFQKHIEAQFKEGMSWKNYGSEWHIDHKIPLKYQKDGQPPSLEEVVERLHYLNTQPMWACENIAKGNRFISE